MPAVTAAARALCPALHLLPLAPRGPQWRDSAAQVGHRVAWDVNDAGLFWWQLAWVAELVAPALFIHGGLYPRACMHVVGDSDQNVGVRVVHVGFERPLEQAC